MKKLKQILSGVFIAALVAVSAMPAQKAEAAVPELSIASKDNKAPVYQAGKAQKWTLVISNNTDNAMENVVIAPELGDTGDAWPFQTDFQSYRKTISILPANSQEEVAFEFTQREDVPTARYTLVFKGYIGDDQEAKVTQNFYVNTTAKPEEKKDSTPGGGSDQPQAVYAGGDEGIEAGGFSNGGASFSGGGSEGSGSVPRVIVTGFTTDPAEVRAGSDFTLTIHLKNTSKSTRVSNMLFNLNAPTEGKDEQTMAPAFLPTSGASSIYLDGIAANGTAEISIQLNAKADLLQKPYSIDMGMKYEDANAAQIEADSSISIPVKQDARFEFSDFDISPEAIAVGEEGNVSCSLYNLGRIKLYNVKATFEGAGIKKEEVFVGNVESGAAASIDAMLEGKKATKGPAKVTMTLSYEDEAGKVSTTTKDLQLEVTEMSADDAAMMEIPQEEQGKVPVVPIAIAVVIIVGIVVAVVIIRKKKKKQMLNEEEGLLDELDGPSEDEH